MLVAMGSDSFIVVVLSVFIGNRKFCPDSVSWAWLALEEYCTKPIFEVKIFLTFTGPNDELVC